jgi:hypothetical protein
MAYRWIRLVKSYLKTYNMSEKVKIFLMRQSLEGQKWAKIHVFGILWSGKAEIV